ncbi:MAG: siphovirus ReqiPepy6 Gp37-like family protein [Lachnospiraceae bacterium]|nr:siphovirus ReqiPepy6 Gp37-like family protein [Lachnospiraceae bacterium]
MMEFYVVNPALEIIGIVDTYKSAIWTERYYSSGDFELYVPASAEMLNLLQKQNFVVRVDDLTKAMIIESIKLTTDADSGDYLTVTGRSISSILSRRIVWTQTTYVGNLEQAVRRMVTDNLISPEDNERGISGITLGAEAGLTDEIQIQFLGDVVETAIQGLCKAHGIGYALRMDLANRQMSFELYKGVDRSYNQNVTPFVVFSDDFENLLSSEYSNNDARFANVAQVAGEGEGVARKKVVVGSATGLARFEVFVDAKGQSTNGGELDETTYASLLRQKGTEKLATLYSTENVDGKVAPNHIYKLGVDYFIGDLVQVINEYGISMTPRVTEVIECQNEQGYTCIPTFAQDD